ncbi:MAG TPA: HNH endonuclease [Spirochaetes bacterium]|nr:HNH endonuclease [Spirochaetota bacterium]
MDTMNVLLLNNTYEPVKVISWQKAIILHFKEKVDIIEVYEDFEIHSEKLALNVPAVVRLHYYVNIHKHLNLRLSKENIFYRDNYTCAYCGKRLPKDQLTLDHVIPLSKGGKKAWNNIVAACNSCNNKKGNHLPEHSHFRPMKKPFEPSVKSYLSFFIKVQRIPDQWKDYLPS